ncbi:GNAT superfamily N-acetyltransferase [Alkalihalobacillus xiaoxiensis]|uniref:GNAT superfamily N-acetyltransferase n=1 Tax=Shouchella xiaoxiensis TaxID=766895 RepID=A0ABS2SUE2_9BACI|nr:GNAT family N-acetyltransferase [Shouchella xiaoxiensis]MBM7839168.1 GNAT superfamily N-acetyltransferase [Shouchella xiaoxiensis]
MIHVTYAKLEHAKGIQSVCTDGYWASYSHMLPSDQIKNVCEEFYNLPRIENEITETSREWLGYMVALDEDEVVGAIGGGFTGPHTAEVFVLYLNPIRRNERIGTALLDFLTREQIKLGATEQWASVYKDNQKGIPFYRARGFVCISEKQKEGTGLRFKREL